MLKIQKLPEAIMFAVEAHDTQLRRGREPYIMHSLRVMQNVMLFGVGEYVAIAAVLHDVVEDTNVTQKDLENQFGFGATELVRQLTKTEENKDNYLESILNSQNFELILIKFLDSYDNLQEGEGDETFYKLVLHSEWEDNYKRYVKNAYRLKRKLIKLASKYNYKEIINLLNIEFQLPPEPL
ncbi:MAG: hypothetical protein [Bacteriophage sp.]|nr:MAG: hypothetical protein [Bacteriophage sp.]